MNDIKSLSHTKWECKYHLTWIPKYRKKEIYGDLRKHLGEVFRELARRADCEILEGQLLPDHIHMLISLQGHFTVGFLNLDLSAICVEHGYWQPF